MSENRKQLYLLDLMALLYRGYFVFIRNPRITTRGFNTSAIYGFMLSLLEILEKFKPTHIGVAFESETPTVREQTYAEYKAQREPTPNAIIESIPYVKKILKAMGIPALEYPGYEADDIIGTIAKQAVQQGFDVYIVTPDKDFAQLLGPHIYIYRPSKADKPAELITYENVKEHFGVTAEQIIDFFSLVGDKADNVPGVPGIGEKTAIQLLESFHSLDNIYQNLNQITSKSIQKKLIQHKDLAYLSRDLVTIKTDLPIAFEETNFQIKPWDKEALSQLFAELEFESLAKRLSIPLKEAKKEVLKLKTIEDIQPHYQLINSLEKWIQLLDSLNQVSSFALDTETDKLDSISANLIGISIAYQPHHAYYLNLQGKDQKAFLAPFFDFLTSYQGEIIAQNLKYDYLVLQQHGFASSLNLYFDTLLADYVLNPLQRHNIDSMAKRYLNYQTISTEELIGKKGKHQKSMTEVPISLLKDYACEDADITLQLASILKNQIQLEHLEKPLYEIELPLIPVLVAMESRGIRLDQDFLLSYGKELEIQLHHLEKEIYALAGIEFNLNSPKQIADILYNKLKLRPPKVTKGGAPSTDEASLTELAQYHELPAYLLRYRTLQKLKNTYVDTLPTYVNPKTGRVHTSFQQAVTVTGRLSSENPNLQNIPIRSEEGEAIRKAFIPSSPEFVFLSCDYSQIDLRVMAHFSEDANLLKSFKADKDIHSATASLLFEVPEAQVTDHMRRVAKTVNFGLMYGMSAFGLAQRLGISRSEASKIMKTYFEKYPGVKQFMSKAIQEAREKGYAETLFGHRHPLPTINSKNRAVRQAAERNAINTPIQGTSAEIIKIAMIQIHRLIQERYTNQAYMLLQVHDELLFEVKKPVLETFKQEVVHLMENAVTLKVPLKVNVGIGTSWYDVKS